MVMNFYVDMMRREVWTGSDQQPASYLHDSDEDKLEKDDGRHCYPLCERQFLEGDVLRKIHPCGHVFHEKCIQIWLYKGEHQFCPHCRGNIMKEHRNSGKEGAR